MQSETTNPAINSIGTYVSVRYCLRETQFTNAINKQYLAFSFH